ncbi:Crp/Fnr family transcriptional regulator [Roseateles albus]|uniref:Crp/Fnr family transcriptional regulator n=1 Tax=Roseateles albus TaxID=2987525 RepID=A0ABT5KJ36_9BURK|nr:Crp/Fnr family transcriptional regulator [Roseateles albus]MDC8773402.1 Crp/Fnr family transcriptional regulator [Roseateles albus]
MKPKLFPSCEPRQNQLLANLPDEDLAPWAAALEPVALSLGQVLCESGSTAAYAYFPTTAIVSLLYLTQDGESTEIAVVGRDGMVGVSLFMGGNATPSRSVVQSAGMGLRLPAHLVKQAVTNAGALQAMLLSYTQTLMAQVAQTAACNRYHSIDQLLCRRLLMGLDRLPSEAMMMTQELLANLLGVRREGVTAAALKLSQAGLISYSRGRIAVLDRERLEQRMGCPAPAAKPRRTAPMQMAA